MSNFDAAARVEISYHRLDVYNTYYNPDGSMAGCNGYHPEFAKWIGDHLGTKRLGPDGLGHPWRNPNGRWWGRPTNDPEIMVFCFSDKSDAMLFKLRWAGK